LLKRGRPADRQRALSTLQEALDVAFEFGMLRLAKSSKNLLGFDA